MVARMLLVVLLLGLYSTSSVKGKKKDRYKYIQIYALQIAERYS